MDPTSSATYTIDYACGPKAKWVEHSRPVDSSLYCKCTRVFLLLPVRGCFCFPWKQASFRPRRISSLGILTTPHHRVQVPVRIFFFLFFGSSFPTSIIRGSPCIFCCQRLYLLLPLFFYCPGFLNPSANWSGSHGTAQTVPDR